ncbi:hypothetical protein MMC15_006856 [Xylographa vitiligo]|nr:hypothetical protein [Xylographa vitiligo]
MHSLPYAVGPVDDDWYSVREQMTSFCARCKQPQEDCSRTRIESEREVEAEIARRQRVVFDEERLRRFWNRPAETVEGGEERATWREKLMYLWSVDQEHVLDRRFLYAKPLESRVKFDCLGSSTITRESQQQHQDRVIQAYPATSNGKPQYRWPCRLLANSFGRCRTGDQESRKKVAVQYLRAYRTLIDDNGVAGGPHCDYSSRKWWLVGRKMEKDIKRLNFVTSRI